MDNNLESTPNEQGSNTKIWVVVGVIVALIVGFSAGYLMKSNSSSDVEDLQNQINNLNTQNLQLQNQIDELEDEDYFEYTHLDGEKYQVSVSEYSFPLNNTSKISLMNKIWLKYYPGKASAPCGSEEDLFEQDVKDVNLNYLYTISSCNNVGFIIDEDSKTIEFKPVTSTT